MYVFTMLNNFGNKILVFLILENLLMVGLFINSIIHYFKIRKFDKVIKEIKQ